MVRVLLDLFHGLFVWLVQCAISQWQLSTGIQAVLCLVGLGGFSKWCPCAILKATWTLTIPLTTRYRRKIIR